MEIYSYSLKAGKSEIKVPAQSESGEASLPGLQTAVFWLCLHMVEHTERLLFFFCILGMISALKAYYED